MSDRSETEEGRLLAVLRSSSALRDHVKPGKRGLAGADGKKVRANPSNLITDSLALDSVLAHAHPGEPRWDYWLGTRDAQHPLIAVEIHDARRTSEADLVIRKKAWACKKAEEHFKKGNRISRWCWISSGRTGIAKTTSQYRRLRAAGIDLVGAALVLRRH